MSNKVDKDRQRAIRRLLDNLRDLQTSPRKSHKSVLLEHYIQQEPIFGTAGDRLLHVLIRYENPTNLQKCETSLWSDAPDLPINRTTEFDTRAGGGGAGVASANSLQGIRQPAIVSARDSSRPGQRKESYASPKPGTKPDFPRSETSSRIELPIVEQQSDDRGLGRLLLKWLLQHKLFKTYFKKKPDAPSGQNKDDELLPLHLSITIGNIAFLSCFIGLYCDPKCKDLRKDMDTIIEAKNSLGGNCIHAAIEIPHPFTSCLVAVCSEAALKLKDNSKQTPLHFAVVHKNGSRQWIPPAPAVFKKLNPRPPWQDQFDSEEVFAAIESRSGGEELLRYLLTSVNNEGASPLQGRLRLTQVTPSLANRIKAKIFSSVESIADVSTALYGTTGATKELYLNMADFNQASHNFHGFVEKLTQTASVPHGAQFSDPAKGAATPSPDQPAPAAASVRAAHENQSVNFEEILFFVHLPDLNYVKQPCPHSAISKLFQWLKASGVHTIRKLRLPDNTQTPLSEAFVQKYILDEFHIESFDWRKLDVNIDIMLRCAGGNGRVGRGQKSLDVINTANVLKSLTLYSSGSWSTLYHWSSNEGLVLIPGLRKAQINIVQLNQTEDFDDGPTHKRHLELANLYASRLRKRFAILGTAAGQEYVKNWEVKVDANWDYPLPPQEPEEPSSQIVKHQFTSQLLPSVNALGQLEAINTDTDEHARTTPYIEDGDDSVDDESGEDTDDDDFGGFFRDKNEIWEAGSKRFRPVALAPRSAADTDRRIRVAIIDNGADRVRSRFRHQIAKGQSFVSADEFHSDQPLPWWMVSDAHGTQMASLVSQTNPYCRLYIVRVGTRRNDIRAESAVKAINWAMEHDVDIISMSWTLDYDDPVLKTVIEKASARRILLFAATPDEGMYSQAWPAHYTQHTISVSATDQYGHLTSKARATTKADVQIPGENIRAAGPGYIGNTSPLVSGSSVATALAAGLASLALLLMQTFNSHLPIERPGSEPYEDADADAKHKRHYYYTKEGMLSVFERMTANKDQAILLRHMFPTETVPKDKVLEKLSQLWNVQNWKKRRVDTDLM